MSPNPQPTLKAPGAGLPALELFVARRLFALRRRREDRESLIRRFEDERSGIRALVNNCPASLRGIPVLIRRLRGLEDSSRYWSVWMTLDHLRITNLGFARFIDELTSGKVPELTVSTADVKPDPDVTEAIDGDYEASCDLLLDVLTDAPELKTKLRFPHPWFGPLDAFGWLALASTHMGIHRAQIAATIRGLPQ